MELCLCVLYVCRPTSVACGERMRFLDELCEVEIRLAVFGVDEK